MCVVPNTPEYEACARVVIHSPAPADGSLRVVTPEAVAEVLSEWTGIPLAEISRRPSGVTTRPRTPWSWPRSRRRAGWHSRRR